MAARRGYPWCLPSVLAAGCLFGPSDGLPPLLKRLPRDLTTAESRAVVANNDFTFALLERAVADEPRKNVFVSPLSVSMVLGMLGHGARGATRDSIMVTLGLGGVASEEVGDGYRGLRELILGLDKRTEMRLANSLWTDRGFPIRPAFVTEVKDDFGAEARSLDFADPGSITTINQWVRDQTAGRIPSILDRIAPGEILFALNAMYFKGRWREQFKPASTQPRRFAARGGDQTVPFMHRSTDQPYGQGRDLEVTDLWYGNGAYTFTVVLPAPGLDVDRMIAELDVAKWTALVAGMLEISVAFSMPKFRLEYARSLRPDLSTLGMAVAFGDRADFSGIANGQLALSRVDHRTFVEVNEEGTEAAAVTSGGLTVTDGPLPMTVDRPYLFLIRERLSGTILFAGRMVSIP